jgi:His-Xaa-Ser system radical SAM maturase HxsB
MKTWPLRFRQADDTVLLVDDAGGYFQSDHAFLNRYAHMELSKDDERFLLGYGHAFETEGDLSYLSFGYRWTARQAKPGKLSYLILVPTLRCNLACTYCQVSRAPERAPGFDWTDQTTDQVIALIDGLETEAVKIEFQGGEPLLRLDLLERVRSFCRKRFREAQFVVCTNLQVVSEAAWSFLSDEDTFISTSFDGDLQTHERQRTVSPQLTRQFSQNLALAMERVGTRRLSALPTIDVRKPPKPTTLLQNFEELGLRSIYLRPVSYHGFARKTGSQSNDPASWNKFHRDFMEALIERNYRTGRVMEEFYFSQCLKRVLRPGVENHVDLRNPNMLATDYVVIDHDGGIYPTDEARMLARIGRIDLSIGNVTNGIDRSRVTVLNEASLNNFDPDCIHCVYQPFCGSDLVDDISRFGRMDLPRTETWFCRRQLGLFDFLFSLIYRDDEATRFSLSSWANIETWPTQLAPRHR